MTSVQTSVQTPASWVGLAVALAATVALAGPLPAQHPIVSSPAGPSGAHASEPVAPGRAAAAPSAALQIPPAFVANLGQWPVSARYIARFPAAMVELGSRGWNVCVLRDRRDDGAGEDRVRGVCLAMRFAGAGEAELAAEQRAAGVENFLLGDRESWRTHVPRYRQVRYRGLYDGVEVLAHGVDDHFEYDVVVAPGAELASVVIEVEGADRLWIDADGDLVLETPVGQVRQPQPRTWQTDRHGERTTVECRYELLGEGRFGFAAPARDQDAELVIDPGILYSTFFSFGLITSNVIVDERGQVTFCGAIGYNNLFPVTPGAIVAAPGGDFDGFVARFDPSLPPSQQLVFATYVATAPGTGGAGSDSAQALHVDANGLVTVVGATKWRNLPVTPGAYQSTLASTNTTGDAFVMRLDPSQTGMAQLVYGTYLGGSQGEAAHAVSVDAAGLITVCGDTRSPNFPTTANAFAPTNNGGTDAWLARLDPSRTGAAQLVYSTYYGGNGEDWGLDLVVGPLGKVFFCGATDSSNLPTTPGAFDTTYNGNHDAWVAQFDLNAPTPAQQLVAATYLGGVGPELQVGLLYPWQGAYLGTDRSGLITVAGSTRSADFPTTANAWSTAAIGDVDVFVSRLTPDLTTLLYSTFLGGGSYDEPQGMALSPSGVVTLAGWTAPTLTLPPAFPSTPGAWATTNNGGNDAFVLRLDPWRPASQQLIYSTFLGGSDNEETARVDVDALGVAAVVGRTESANFPTTPATAFNAVNPNPGPWPGVAFLTLLDMLPTGARMFGTSTPGCDGRLGIGVTSMPRIGNQGFALTCEGAPPGGIGLVLLSYTGRTAPLVVLGVDVWVGPGVALIVQGNSSGAAEWPLPIPANPNLTGLQLNAQFGWFGPSAPPPCPTTGWSASNALEITIWP